MQKKYRLYIKHSSSLHLIAFILIMFFCIATKLQSQQRFKFERLKIDHGLTHKRVYCVTQDSKGFLWFGTEEGLAKYDGYEFKIYTHDPKDSMSISNDYILSICESHDGNIWLGTYGGLNKFDPQLEKFTYYKHDPSDSTSISNNYIWAIIEGHKNNLWLGTYDGLNKFNPNTGRFTHYKHKAGDETSLSNNYVWAIHEGQTGEIWVGTYEGLNRFDPAKEIFHHYKHIPGNESSISHNDVRAIYEDMAGNLWVGTYGGLNKFDFETETFKRYIHDPNDPHSLSDNQVRTITTDNLNALWVGTANGLNRLANTNGKFLHMQSDKQDPNSLSSNDILSLFEDKFGTLWIGTSKDMNKFDPINEKFLHFKKNPEKEQTLAGNNVTSIFEDQNDNIWIGTSQGLSKYNPSKNTYTNYKNNPRNPFSLSYDYILSITQDKDGIYWIGTYGGGLNRFNPQSGRFFAFYNNPMNPQSISNDKIWAIFEDSEKNLWIGTYGGLNKFNNVTGEFTTYQHDPNDTLSISNNYVLSFCEEGNTLWIGTDNGLNKFNKNDKTFQSYLHIQGDTTSISNNTVWSIYKDKNSMLWLGTHGGGLNLFDPAKEEFKHWLEKDGLSDNIVYGVLGDSKGNIWMSTNNGISKFIPKYSSGEIIGGNFRNYDISDGIQGMEFNGGAYFKSDDGRIYFGGNNGFNAFFPDSVKDNTIPPEVVITGFKIFNKKVKILKNKDENNSNKIITKDGEYYLPRSIAFIDQLSLSYKENVFSIDFAALHYSLPENNRYAYRLEGLEKNWNYTHDKRTANYTNLDPGSYTFSVKAANCDGTWNEEGTSLEIYISPPFWQTWAFRIGVVIFLLAGIYGYIKYRERKIQKQKKVLERMVAERTYELEKQKEKIEEHKGKIEKQRDEITKKNKNITDSIKYALKIQQAILPPDERVAKYLPDSFIFYRPKDIVSGDFYWLREKDGSILFAAVDCTGHGVPGAFMSIVANNLLNQAVNENRLEKPSDILNFLDKGVNETLGQNIEDSYMKDGMDMAFCRLNKESMKLEYAGAYNPLYLIRNKEIIQYKADGKSIEVSQSQKIKTFTNNTIQLIPGDIIYIFTDGFVDQFGGPNRKKYLKKRLRETLLRIHQFPLQKQKEALERTFKQWKGKNEQIDDVLIVGVKF